MDLYTNLTKIAREGSNSKNFPKSGKSPPVIWIFLNLGKIGNKLGLSCAKLSTAYASYPLAM